jgi:hypothetical protein
MMLTGTLLKVLSVGVILTTSREQLHNILSIASLPCQQIVSPSFVLMAKRFAWRMVRLLFDVEALWYLKCVCVNTIWSKRGESVTGA